MASYASSCCPIAIQSVRDAISKDGSGETKESYCIYLSSMLFMVQALKDEAWDKPELKDLCHEATFKLFKLTEQCLERAHDILKSLADESKNITSPQNNRKGGGKDGVNSLERRHSQPPASTLLAQLPRSQRTASYSADSYGNQNNNKKESYHDLITSLPSPPGYSKAQNSSKTFQVQNHEMFQAYQRRKTLSKRNITQKYAAASYNLSLFRQAAEKMALTKAKEKAMQERLLERQNQMKIEAERRWNNRNNRLSRDKEYRQNLLASILSFEQDVRWPLAFRDTLTVNKDDTAIIINVVQAILSCKDHPLSKVLHEIQYSLYEKIKLVLNSGSTPPKDKNKTINIHLAPVDAMDTYNKDKCSGESVAQENDTKIHITVASDFNEKQTDTQLEESEDAEDLGLNSSLPTKQIDSNSDVVNEISEQLKSKKSISFDQAFNDLEDEMFSSDSEEEIETQTVTDIDKSNSAIKDENAKSFSEVLITPLNNNKNNESEHNHDEIIEDEPHYECLSPEYDHHNPWNEKTSMKENELYKQDTTTIDMIEGHGKSSRHSEECTEEEHTDSIETNSVCLSDTEKKTLDDHDNDHEGESDYTPLLDDREESIYQTLNKIPTVSKAEVSPAETTTSAAEVASDKVIAKINTIGEHFEELTVTISPNTDENLYEDLDVVHKGVKTRGYSMQTYSQDIFSPDIMAFVDTEFLKKLDGIVQELLFGIDRLHSVLILTYEALDSPAGRDQSYATLESIFFKPLWPWLIKMFRRMNCNKEEALIQVMKKYESCVPQDMKIRDKFTLFNEENPSATPYQTAIDEMRQLANFTCPLEKLECSVRTSKAICHSVETYWVAKGASKPPSVGCDDLLPIISYVIIKSQLPQIVSEVHAMEEFIHEGYLMGEEGYCLTTLHAAISYLLTLGKDM